MSKKKLLLSNHHKARAFAFLFFFLIAIILFYLCRYLFFYDEDIFVVNPHSSFMLDFRRGLVVKLTFLGDNLLWKTNSTGYHVTNIMLHLCNTILATYTFNLLLKFTILDEVRARSARYIFLFLFLISPIHSEPLCYLLGRAGLVVTLCCILSLLFFLKANFKNTGLLIISLSFFLLALFSYEISWTFPLIILLIVNYLKQYHPLSRKKIVIYITPFFIVLALWLLIKIVFLNHSKITPYGSDIFLSFSSLRLIKNMLVLFFRNVVPPFESTLAFVTLSVIVATILVYIFIRLKNKNMPLLFFALLIISNCCLAYLPALVFGISSHNSESERYIYFSSVFAIMLFALSVSLLNKAAKKFVAVISCCIYAYFLFIGINSYVQGAKFSQNYLALLSRQENAKRVYLVDQPSQYKGALLFRANGDMPNSSKKRITTIQDFLYTLYQKDKSEYITLSKKEILSADTIKNVIHLSADSLPLIFPGFYFDKTKKVLINSSASDSAYFESGNNLIAGLKLQSLYIFK